nr:PREDICTED: next to BRCA1 gene 1 protein-like [Paralichthys olivaceus]
MLLSLCLFACVYFYFVFSVCVCVCACTQLVFMWGNLDLASEKKREVPVPLLLPGQVGVVSVAFVAPVMEGTYTSHWRLAHCGCQFGPRVWCSIVVDPGNSRSTLGQQSKRLKEEVRTVEKEMELRCDEFHHDDFYFPSVDLLTAQDLLSFELLDINIVQELEKVPNNTPVDLTPCISPLPHDPPLLEKAITSQIKEDTEVTGVRKLFGVKLRQQREMSETVTQEDEKEEEISGAQFLCETVIRSLTLEEAPDHRPLRRLHQSSHKPQIVSRGTSFCFERAAEAEKMEKAQEGNTELCALRLESSAPPPDTGLNQISQEEETRPVLLLEPVTENVHISSLRDTEDEEVVVLDEMQVMKVTQEEKDEGAAKGEDWDEVSSQTSSVSSCDDYIIVLPDCFDTTRPLGESMYSSAMSQPDIAAAAAAETSEAPDVQQPKDDDSDCEPGRTAPPSTKQERSEVVAAEDLSVNVWLPPVPLIHSSVNQMLCASQTLDAVTLTPEVVPPPPILVDSLLSPPALYSPRSEALYLAEDPSPPACDPYEPRQPRVHLNVSSGLSRSAGSASSAFETYNPRPSNALQPRGQGGITEGLVKGALSVAASAYKALFTGPNCPIQRGIDPATRQDPSMMAMLLEMGFRDHRLNQRLLRKHGYSLLHTVNELVQMAEERQNEAVEARH